ncbi:MAG: DUF1816 domain-containing protein [Spirulinaceae cyanobacterium]
MKDFLTNLLQLVGAAVWIEITTETPKCTYYFGPFTSKQEAQNAQAGYLEDLKSENAQGIVVSVKRCNPSKLTIYDELGESRDLEQIPSLSGQIS